MWTKEQYITKNINMYKLKDRSHRWNNKNKRYCKDHLKAEEEEEFQILLGIDQLLLKSDNQDLNQNKLLMELSLLAQLREEDQTPDSENSRQAEPNEFGFAQP